MIVVYNDIMTDHESKEFIEYYENNMNKELTENDNIYRFKGIDITHILYKFSFLKKFGLQFDTINKLRIQRVDDTIKMIETYHKHFDPYSFVCFLNNDFEGGELVFNDVTFQPKKNQMVYFTREERHLVKNVSNGYRYTLVCFLKRDLFNNLTKVDKIM
jgi:hypothetical protein